MESITVEFVSTSICSVVVLLPLSPLSEYSVLGVHTRALEDLLQERAQPAAGVAPLGEEGAEKRVSSKSNIRVVDDPIGREDRPFTAGLSEREVSPIEA